MKGLRVLRLPFAFRRTCGVVLSVSLALTSCLIACDAASDQAAPATGARFTHGVASGDPDQQSVLLWTRLLTPDHLPTMVAWEIAEDAEFQRVAGSGAAVASPEHDFCVKVIADQLPAGTSFFYRFYHENTTSPVGRTRTLPRQTDHVRIGVANCAKYTGGFYHAYDALAETDELDVVIHLGDYIYDNGAAKPGNSYYPSSVATGRQHDPPHDCNSLEDYRTRYAQYRGDPDLLKLHARHPMINIWDDHDIATIPKRKLPDGLPDYDSNWQERLDNSLQAWHEWIPSRVDNGGVIYRSFQFGDVVNLLMLDTRVCCKSRVTRTAESLDDMNRHIVGDQQLEWMFADMLQHNAAWNVVGNQLLVATKDAGWERWSGFPADLNRLLQFLEGHPQLNFLVTTGNAHNPHHYIVRDRAQRETLFHEVLPGSISSGNNAEKAKFDAEELQAISAKLDAMDNVLWYHNNSHGYITIDVTSERARVDWHFVSDIRKRGYEVTVPYTITIPSRAGANAPAGQNSR